MSQENLSAKFDEVKAEIQALIAVQQDYTTAFAGLQTSLDTISSKLDSVTNAIWALQGVSNRTLTDLYDKPVTLEGDATIDVTGVETRLDSIITELQESLKTAGSPAIPYLLQLRGALADDFTSDSTSVRQAIWGLAGPAPGTDLTQIWNKIDALHSAFGYSAVSGWSLRAHLENALGSEAGISLYNLLDQAGINLFNVLSAIGTPTGDATTTVLGRLIAIMGCACSTASHFNPPLPLAADCLGTQYQSSGFSIAEYGAQGDMAIAYWETAPEGITQAGVGELTPDTDWTGWKVYVTSTAEYFGYKSGFSNRLPTNTWIELDSYGSDTLTFAVDKGYGLTVTLCSPSSGSGVEIGTCFTINSQALTSSRWGYVYHILVFPEIPGFTRLTHPPTDPTDTYGGAYVGLQGDFTGWNIKAYKEGNLYNPQWFLNGVTRQSNGDLSGTGSIGANHSSNHNNQAPFYAELCYLG